jgi:peptidoglycan-associated lipoprotein
MKKAIWMIPFVMLALALSSCGGDEAVKPEVDDKSGAQTTGTGSSGADLLSERRVHFEFDSSAVDSESAAIIEAHAKHLSSNTSLNVTLEGHADERGTREYNLALGERRAQAVARMMKALGVSGSRIKNVSYGEEKPLALEHNESGWRQNRRVEIIY